jgi:hypothetical protein
MAAIMIYIISPHPSFPKRGTLREAEIFITDPIGYTKRQNEK